MPVRLEAVAFACDDPAAVGTFWSRLLARELVARTEGVLVPGDPTQLDLRFVPGRAPQPGVSRMHLHLTSTSLEHQRTTVTAALGLGARHLDVGQRPEEGHVVLADPGGYAFCVIEPGNSYLAGTGFLGELACDGSRDAGLFWSAALDWPLVWDQDEETAIQSPAGGTKVAWGGPPVPPVNPGEPQQFQLVAPDGALAAEVDRLVALGAARHDNSGDGSAVLADPDGLPFRVYGR